MKLYDKILFKVICPFAGLIGILSIIICIAAIISPPARANFAPKTQVEQCISLSSGKLVVPNEAAMTVSPSCLESSCYAIPIGFSCIYYKVSGEILEEDATKKSAYDAQKAAAESTQSVYQESQLYNNIQDYCLYTTGLPCPQMPPATYNATANNLAHVLGKTPAQIKKLMNKKRK